MEGDDVHALSDWKRKQALAVIILALALKKTKLRRRWENRHVWSHSWLIRRPRLGAHNTIVQGLRVEDKMNFRSYLRMDEECFRGLLEMLHYSVDTGNHVTKRHCLIGWLLADKLRNHVTRST